MAKKLVNSSDYLATLKSLDTEEHIDLAFYRPIGYAWACLARRLGITPNVITIASVFLGMGAAVAFYFNNIWINIVGIILLVWANSFDSADGQLARMTQCYSRLGRILDGLSGDIWFACIYVAVCLRENAFSPFFGSHPWVIWTLAVVTGLCHAKQAAMADYYRQFHLYFLKGSGGSELESTAALRRRYAAMSWRSDFWARLVMAVYIGYTMQQESMTPSMQRLRRTLKVCFPDGDIPVRFRQDFRRRSLPLMKYTNILSFNWRSIALFVSLLVGQPWLYFVFELVVLNLLLVYMMLRHERMCGDMVRKLENGDYGTPGTGQSSDF